MRHADDFVILCRNYADAEQALDFAACIGCGRCYKVCPRDVLDLIDREGAEAGIEHLSGWDYGSETTDAAMENGDVHDRAPVYAGDRQAETGDYAMTYNPQDGHVALYRRHLIRGEDAIDPTAAAIGAVNTVKIDGGVNPSEVPEHDLSVQLGGWIDRKSVV